MGNVINKLKKSNELFPFSNKGPHPKENERKRLTHFTHFWIISFNLVGNLKLALLTKPKSLTHRKTYIFLQYTQYVIIF